MTALKFTKMQGLGNDFVVLDGDRAQRVALDAATQSARLADRRFGVGCDQVLVGRAARRRRTSISATASSTPTAARSSNAATARAASSRFVRDQGLTDKRDDPRRDRGGVIVPRLEADGQVTRRHGRAALRRRATFRSSAATGAR